MFTGYLDSILIECLNDEVEIIEEEPEIDIQKIGGINMNLDITYCNKIDCKNLKCERNQNKLQDLYNKKECKYISIGNFPRCEYWEGKNE